MGQARIDQLAISITDVAKLEMPQIANYMIGLIPRFLIDNAQKIVEEMKDPIKIAAAIEAIKQQPATPGP